MNQKLSEWASVAEIVSGVAVVLTLIFLAVGIRENTEITRAAAYDRSIDSLNQWRLGVMQDESLVRVWVAYLERDVPNLTKEDYFRLGLLLNTQWGVYEKSYFANQYGILGPAEWSRFEKNICIAYDGTHEANVWNEIISDRLTEEFLNYAISLCEGK